MAGAKVPSAQVPGVVLPAGAAGQVCFVLRVDEGVVFHARRDEAAARHHYRNCADALELLFLAAVRSREGQAPCRLPAVVDSFVAWCRETGEEFRLEPDLQELLGQRTSKQPLTHTYGEWRRTAKEDPSVARIWGFQDDPKKSDGESRCLEAELAPIWRPGYHMRRPAG